MDIPSKIDEKRLNKLRGKYQIPDKVNPRFATPCEWCCNPNFGVGICGGLRLPLNGFARELLHRLGVGPNNLTLMHGEPLCPRRCCLERFSTGTVLLLWTSSCIIINPLK